ncbi:MBL fold metallo-hydrolase [Levilactobacillus suantsaii]|uniref:MBL fold metallo-hydrolase n=1 Tax=Levilactobacillus suantsaii TaxID=2292255 RepID=A0A4Q0VKX8_9LACO|nr:MBL fold metallo-hydrolase [Levilactobacillus suantsaii]QMU07856.1 MBL fold metallo-hydrolase [Levilactobacillus suantsaii]RXI79486.1 MBL fold metallo-hydrolase [Levilactobacillus suantsaii]
MDLTVLGCYGGYPFNGIGTSSYLISSGDYRLLLDCGSGALTALQRYLDPLQLDAVLLTHYHHDHIADVGVLQYLWQLAPGEKKEAELPIYGHTADQTHFESLTWPHATVGRPYDPQQTLTLGPLTVTFMATHHPVPAYAPIITETATGKRLAFTADTAAFPELTTWAQGADTLLADTNFYADHQGTAWHLTSTQAGELARQAQVRRLLLTHLPQTGSLAQLQREAQAAAGPDIPVAVVQAGATYRL